MSKARLISQAASAFAIMSLGLGARADQQHRSLYRRADVVPPPLPPPISPPNNITPHAIPPALNNITSNAIPHAPAIIQPVTGSPGHPDPCGVYPLDQSTWMKFGWDEYLRTYPNGHNLTVQEYAASVNASNFKCGIGENCNIGQLCSPVTAPDFYILYAAQHLNTYLNTLYQVTGEAISLGQSTMSSVWGDLFPALVDHSDLKAVFAFAAGGAVIQTLGALYLIFVANPAVLFVTAPFALLGVVSLPFTLIMLASLTFIITAQTILSAHDMSGPVQSEEFNDWSEFNYRLSQWQEATQKLVANSTQRVFTSPISSDSEYSLRQMLKNGTFLNPIDRKNTFELQTDLKNITTSLAISHLLRAMNAFVTISDDDPENKKWDPKNSLTYTSPNGTVMNIIRVVPGETKAINDFKNANVLSEKYGFSTEHIATVSWECQQKYGMKAYNMTDVNVNHPAFIQSPNECSFNLPVCDLRGGEARKRKGHHVRTVRICRQMGVPIL